MAALTNKPTLHYFGILGRGEPIRMTFAAAGVAFDETPIDFASMKAEAGTSTSLFGQAPMLDVEGVRLSQMSAIMKYVAAASKPALLGGDTPLARASVDMLMNSVDDLYLKYIDCVYGQQLSDEGKEKLWAAHYAISSATERNGGAHLSYLVGYLKRSGGPFLCGPSCTIADIFFYFTLEAFCRDQCFGGKVCETYPELSAYMSACAAVPGLKERLADPARAALDFNGNGQG